MFFIRYVEVNKFLFRFFIFPALWVYLWLAIHSLYIALREKESNIENIGLLNGSNSGQPIDDNYDRLQDTMLQDV